MSLSLKRLAAASELRQVRKRVFLVALGLLIAFPIVGRIAEGRVRASAFRELYAVGSPSIIIDEVDAHVLKRRVTLGYVELIWTLSDGRHARLRLTDVVVQLGVGRAGWHVGIRASSGEWAWADETSAAAFAGAFRDLAPADPARIRRARFTGVTDRVADLPSQPKPPFNFEPVPGDRTDIAALLSAFAASRAPRD